MKRKRMAKSLRKFIRKEKARIRRSVLSLKEQNTLIDKIYKNINFGAKEAKNKL